jgi:uncharacterized membrane protein YkvA (DUF1232 family)
MTETSKETTRRIVKRITHLPVAHQMRLIARLVRDRRVPWAVRLPLIAVLAYLAMPFDFIPDFIPVIGQLDDLLVVALATWWFVRSCPPHLTLPHLEALEALPLTRFDRLWPWLAAALLAIALAFALWVTLAKTNPTRTETVAPDAGSRA